MSELRFLKKGQRFRFPMGRCVYCLNGFDSANRATYSPVNSTVEYKTDHLTLRVVIV